MKYEFRGRTFTFLDVSPGIVRFNRFDHEDGPQPPIVFPFANEYVRNSPWINMIDFEYFIKGAA